MERRDALVSSGIQGLDTILLGGFQKGNVILVEGGPGAGKTTLGLEFVYRGVVERDEPGLVVSFELSPEKLLRDAASFGWKLEELQAQGRFKVIYTSPTVLLHELHSHGGVLTREMEEMGARRLLVDGLTPLKLFAELEGKHSFRDSLHLLVEGLQRFDVTAMLTREVSEHQRVSTDAGHEEYLCDTVLALRQEVEGTFPRRSLEVIKSRGQDFIAGRHTLRIEGGRGVRVYQRAHARPRLGPEQPTSTERHSIGVPAVDEMLGGGLYNGSITLTVGISGTGKTVLGTQYLVESAREGEKGLLVTLDEHPEQLLRNAASLGVDLRGALDSGRVLMYYDSPLELELDVHFARIRELIEEHDVQRVVLDSLAVYESSAGHHARNFIYALGSYFKDRLITAIFNLESPELLGVSQISEELKASTIVDNIILFNYVEVSTRLRRAITVPKARGSAPARETREFDIGPGGITLLAEDRGQAAQVQAVPQLPLSSYYGVLARSPPRRSPVIEERLAEGKGLPDSPRLEPQRPARGERKTQRSGRAGAPPKKGRPARKPRKGR